MSDTATPVEIAEVLGQLYEGGLSDRAIVPFFKRAFPQIPLRVLLDSCTWHRVSGPGGTSDEEFNELLGPWLKID
jgi:hypothetical protein